MCETTIYWQARLIERVAAEEQVWEGKFVFAGSKMRWQTFDSRWPLVAEKLTDFRLIAPTRSLRVPKYIRKCVSWALTLMIMHHSPNTMKSHFFHFEKYEVPASFPYKVDQDDYGNDTKPNLDAGYGTSSPSLCS
jgi:hypothetical protein